MMTDIVAVLQHARRILAITHISPDGDAIGSLLGFGWVIRSLPDWRNGSGEGRAALVCADGVPPQFEFLPGSGDILCDAPPGPWDAVVALDASDPQRLGDVYHPEGYGRASTIVIDHHVTNLRFGALNWVDAKAAATSQIVVQLADALQVPVPPEAATCLLAGLVTDTRGFRTSNVTLDVMTTVQRLMQAGANLADISERTLNFKPYGLIRLWGPALDRVQMQDRVIWTCITQDMRVRVDAPDNGDGGIVSFLLNAPEAHIAAVFAETRDGEVEVGLRARPGFDVSGVALSLGGGGHAQASGCTIPGPLEAAVARVLPLLHRAEAQERQAPGRPTPGIWR